MINGYILDYYSYSWGAIESWYRSHREVVWATTDWDRVC